jgi:hypothetical protein
LVLREKIGSSAGPGERVTAAKVLVATEGNLPRDIAAEINLQVTRLGKAIAAVSNNDVIKYPDIQ